MRISLATKVLTGEMKRSKKGGNGKKMKEKKKRKKGEQMGEEKSKEDKILRECRILGDSSPLSNGDAKCRLFVGQFSLLLLYAFNVETFLFFF